LKRKGLSPIATDSELFTDILAALRDKRLYREGVRPLLESALIQNRPVWELLPAAGSGDLAADTFQIAGSLKGRRFENGPRRMRRAMGLLMADWRGRADGAEASRIMTAGLAEVRA
jgi:Glu-tRNA(Gln) amidotransferase subunit E-like FAD-binding protein